MMPRIVFAAVAVLSALLGSGTEAQNALPLEVSLVDGRAALLSIEDLDALDQIAFTTSTIWTDGSHEFSGVPVLALLKHLDARGTTLRMSALNDYAVEMPVSELESDAPILATRIDGQTMSVREKGPFWIMYPFDRHQEYQTELNFARSVWQLKKLELLE